MKKLFSLLLLSVSISISSYAGDTSSVKGAIIEAKDAIMDVAGVPDSASLSFSKVYLDVKTGISALASSLKVGAEHVYSVLVRQQLVIAITWLVLLILSLLTWIPFAKFMPSDEDTQVLYVVFIGIILLCFNITCLCHIEIILTGLINPEYGAIKDIISIVNPETK